MRMIRLDSGVHVVLRHIEAVCPPGTFVDENGRPEYPDRWVICSNDSIHDCDESSAVAVLEALKSMPE